MSWPRPRFTVRRMMVAVLVFGLLLGFGLWVNRIWDAEIDREVVLQFADIERHFREKSQKALAEGDSTKAKEFLERAAEYGRAKTFYQRAR